MAWNSKTGQTLAGKLGIPTFISERTIQIIFFGVATLVLLILLAPALYSLPFHYQKDYNEGWNAFHILHAFNDVPLYPTTEALYTNNYPPLSFYVVGAVSALIGDNIIAGRIVSLVCLFLVAGNIVLIVNKLSGDRFIAAMTGFLFACFMAAHGGGYAGLNDPELLAHALMMSGLTVFLYGPKRPSILIATAVLMIAAGMVKHNLIPLPIALTIWLYIRDRQSFVVWIVSAGLLSCATLGLLFLAYGPPVFSGILHAPRSYAIGPGVKQAAEWSEPLQLWLLATVLYLIAERRRPETLLLGLFVVLSYVWGTFISNGVGIDRNAFFDTYTSMAIASGLFVALTLKAQSFWPSRLATYMALAFLFVPALTRLPVKASELLGEMETLPEIERQFEKDVAFVKEFEGPVLCETLALCYWAGKEIEADFFNLGQRLWTDTEQPTIITEPVKAHRYALIQTERGDMINYRLTLEVHDAFNTYYEVTSESTVNGFFMIPRAAN